MSTTIDPARFTFRFECKAHHRQSRALTYIWLTVASANRAKVATVFALSINRYALRDRFQILGERDYELAEFSTTLFDKFGRMKSCFIDDDYHKGSGVWGREMNDGRIMFVFHVTVEPSYRRQGLGSMALRHFLESDRIEEHMKVYCWPSPTSNEARDGNKKDWTREFDIVLSFFRKNNFRRVGCTQFFAYSQDSQHPSRNLVVADDADEYEQRVAHVRPAVKPTVEERLEMYPAHCLISQDKTPAVDQLLRELHHADPLRIHTVDDVGMVPISLAAGTSNLEAVKTLISLDVTEDLLIRLPSNGRTALEICQAKLESSKQITDKLGVWPGNGHSEIDLLIEVNLKRAMGIPVNITDEEYVQNMRYGCTCGGCTDGWLSPRMRFRLQSEAESAPDAMELSLEDFESREPRGESVLFDVFHAYLPLSLRSSLYKTCYSGYINVFRVVGHMFKTGMPSADAIDMELLRMKRSLGTVPMEFFDSRTIQFYTQKGGKVEYVLDAITDSCRQQSSEAGDGSFDELVEEDWNEDGPSEWVLSWRRLPKCANDGEFDLVRWMLGLDPRVPWGPYESPFTSCGKLRTEEDEMSGEDMVDGYEMSE